MTNTKTNDQLPRTLDCIYLRHSPNTKDGHQSLHLPTGHVITRGRAIPFPQNVIYLVHILAIREGMYYETNWSDTSTLVPVPITNQTMKKIWLQH